MRLDVLELVVHDYLEFGRSGDVLPEQWRVHLEGIGLDLADNAPAVGYVLLQLPA